ncbi:heterocyst frequency control protein PatD [Trichothermofontia sp.]
MLPQPYSDAYAHLRQVLLDLEGRLQADPDRALRIEAVTTAQAQFQAVLSLNPEGLSPTQRQQQQAVHPEIHKYLRLLSTDVAFLKAARQATTRQQRVTLMGDRVQTLLRLCDYLLTLD